MPAEDEGPPSVDGTSSGWAGPVFGVCLPLSKQMIDSTQVFHHHHLRSQLHLHKASNLSSQLVVVLGVHAIEPLAEPEFLSHK